MKGTFTITIDTTQDDKAAVSITPEFEAVSEADFILMIAAMCDALDLSDEGRRVAAAFILSGPQYDDAKIEECSLQIRRCP